MEQHEQRNTALVEINATSENTINQSIPDLMSFEPVTWDLLPSSVSSCPSNGLIRITVASVLSTSKEV